MDLDATSARLLFSPPSRTNHPLGARASSLQQYGPPQAAKATSCMQRQLSSLQICDLIPPFSSPHRIIRIRHPFRLVGQPHLAYFLSNLKTSALGATFLFFFYCFFSVCDLSKSLFSLVSPPRPASFSVPGRSKQIAAAGGVITDRRLLWENLR